MIKNKKKPQKANLNTQRHLLLRTHFNNPQCNMPQNLQETKNTSVRRNCQLNTLCNV